MVHIRKVKTFHGLKYAIVDKVTHSTLKVDKKGKEYFDTTTEYLPVEYKSEGRVLPAIFELTNEGLAKAKKVQKLFKK